MAVARNINDDNTLAYLLNNKIVDKIYPVGSIYMSVNNISPQKLFGGTWERITGRFLLAATDNGNSGAAQVAGNTGGEASHTLTKAELPAHEGHMPVNTAANWGDAGEDTYYAPTGGNTFLKYSTTRPYVVRAGNEIVPRGVSVGSNTAHNNMPPYLAVYMWKRTA